MTCERMREGNTEAGCERRSSRHGSRRLSTRTFAQGESCPETSRQNLLCVRVKTKTVVCAEPNSVNWTSVKHKSAC